MNLTRPSAPLRVNARSEATTYCLPPPPADTEHVEELLLASRPNAVSCARMLVGSVCVLLELNSATALELSEVVDELVAHSVATVSGTSPKGLSLLGIRVRIAEATLVVEVWDDGDEPAPELHDIAVFQQARWGYRLDQRRGRVVWCVICRQTQPSARVSLPQRTKAKPFPSPATPVVVQRDPVLLQRVIDGLRALGSAKPVWPQQEGDS